MAIAAISTSSSDGKYAPGTSSSRGNSSSTTAAATVSTSTTTTSTTITSSSSGLPSNSGSSSIGAGSNDSSRNITTTTASNNLIDSASSKSLSNKASTGVSTGATTNPDSNKKVPNDMVDGCAVCLDENASHGNQLVYCDGCNLSVHQGCYGITVIPNGSWFCSRCSSGNRQNKINCELCPAEGGALKKTDTGKWAHVQCALWIPEVLFGDPNNVEPIILTKIHPNRWHLICYICEEKGNAGAARSGVKIDCNYKKQEQNGKNHRPTCAKHFHVTCAQQAGFLREEPKEQPANHDEILYTGYCENHFRKLKSSNNISNTNNNKKKKRSASNPSSSSMLDSASDSSQDNDSSSRRNNAIERDKNNSKRTTTKAIPTNVSRVESTTPTTTVPVNSQSLSTNSTASKTSTRPPVNLTSTGLIASPQSSSSIGSRANTGSSPSTTPKKKRVSKSTQGQNNTVEQPSINNNLLGIDSNNLGTQPSPNKPTPISNASTTNSQDVYDWPTGTREPDKNVSTPNKSNRKKPATSSSQPLNSKSASLVNSQQAVTTGYNATKGGSPNLSISTSPSSASPSSSSTKSASNSSTSVTTSATSSSSSSSSTTSSSPSPALLSPNISNRGSTTRHESPLASNSKTSSDMANRLAPEQMSLANSVSSTPNQLHTRTCLDNSRPDPRKSFANSSSLLSTAVPIPAIDSPMQLGMSPAGDVIPSASGASTSIDGHTKGTIATTSAATSEPDSAQPSIPPLKIPVPQGSATTLQVKLTPKSRAPTRNTKKKVADASAPIATAAPKPDLKPKSTRTRKIASTENGASVPKKPEPKARKGKANAKLTEAVASSSNTNQDDAIPKTPATTGPTKRKSRATSAESNPSTAPTPVKRIRKKKTDTPALSIESKSNPQTALTLPQSTINQQVTGPGPLMISTLAQSNQLPPGFNSADGQNVGNKYGSPMVSPYTNLDGQIAASSLSRSSLTRLFTSSSSGATTNLANQTLDDPTKAFEDLRDYGWSQLSKCVIEQTQQFDIPNLIGTLHYLRAENEKLQNRIRDLTMKRDQLTAMNARLDLPPQLLTQNLANTNPGFSSIVSSLTNSPKGLPIPSPGSAIGKQPLVITSSYNHMGPGHLGPSGFLDRSSPLVAQTHSTLNNIKSSSISTPSPPINALMAAHNNSNRAGLTVNQPYMPNSYPQMNATGQINSTPQGSSFYARQ